MYYELQNNSSRLSVIQNWIAWINDFPIVRGIYLYSKLQKWVVVFRWCIDFSIALYYGLGNSVFVWIICLINELHLKEIVRYVLLLKSWVKLFFRMNRLWRLMNLSLEFAWKLLQLYLLPAKFVKNTFT